MKKSILYAALFAVVIGTTGCNGTLNSEIESMQSETVIELDTTNSSDDVTKETVASEDTVTTQEPVSSNEDNQSTPQALYDFKLRVYFSKEPSFNDEMSALYVDLGFGFDGGEYSISEEGADSYYYDSDLNLLSLVHNDNEMYDITVYDPGVSFNVSAETGPSNEGLELLCADIDKDGEQYSYTYPEHAYRSYTGVWIMGIAQISKDGVGEYDSIWMQK